MRGGRRHPIDGKYKKPVHPPRQQPPNAGLFAFGHIEIVREDQIVAQFVRPLLEGDDGAGHDGIGHGGKDHAEQFGGAGAHALRQGVRHVTHLLGEQAQARPGGRGHVGVAAQGLGNGHDGNAPLGGDVFQANHALQKLKF